RDAKAFDTICQTANPEAAEALKKARNLIFKRNYRLNLIFVTTGRVSNASYEDAFETIEEWQNASLDVRDRFDLARLMQDYIDGVSPPVPTITLPIQGEQMFSRSDNATSISSWIFTMQGKDVGRL